MQIPRDEEALADWEAEGGSPACRDCTGRSSEPADGRGAAAGVDPDLSYLGLTWLRLGDATDDRTARATMSRADARGMWSSYLTPERFSFFLGMRDVFGDRRRVGEAAR